jgi:hypothetical protein
MHNSNQSPSRGHCAGACGDDLPKYLNECLNCGLRFCDSCVAARTFVQDEQDEGSLGGETVGQEQPTPVDTPSEMTLDSEGHRQERHGDYRGHEFVAGEAVDDIESGEIMSSVAQTSLTTSNDNATGAFSPPFRNLTDMTLFHESDSGVAELPRRLATAIGNPL